MFVIYTFVVHTFIIRGMFRKAHARVIDSRVHFTKARDGVYTSTKYIPLQRILALRWLFRNDYGFCL